MEGGGYDWQDAGQQEIVGITSDSRKVQPGFVFVALVGSVADGHDFIAGAVQNGAALVVMAKDHKQGLNVDCPVLVVADTNNALGSLAACFYGFPARSMTLVGVTGTNGKTTCAYLIQAMLLEAGFKTGIIGTVSYQFGEVEYAASHTTPDAVQLQQLLAEMSGAGMTHVVMEVSSHALIQKRVAGLLFDVALFTNLSRDHLDYHQNMMAYYGAKEKLFTDFLAPDGVGVVVDAESDWSNTLVSCLIRQEKELVVCGKNRDVSYGNVHSSLEGMQMDIDLTGQPILVTSPLVGDFNLQNILGTMGVGKALGIETKAIIQGIKGGKGAPGRMEQIVISEVSHPALFVDYAHTPDALEKVLATLKGLTQKRVIVVFGCGGDRDTGKRPLMGWAAEKGADISIATSDNPRSEDPLTILEAIEDGMQEAGGAKLREGADFTGNEKGYFIIESRRQAIACAISLAEKDDVVLISGKGHENYQETQHVRTFFDDRQEATKQLKQIWGQTTG